MWCCFYDLLGYFPKLIYFNYSEFRPPGYLQILQLIPTLYWSGVPPTWRHKLPFWLERLIPHEGILPSSSSTSWFLLPISTSISPLAWCTPPWIDARKRRSSTHNSFSSWERNTISPLPYNMRPKIFFLEISISFPQGHNFLNCLTNFFKDLDPWLTFPLSFLMENPMPFSLFYCLLHSQALLENFCSFKIHTTLQFYHGILACGPHQIKMLL